MPINLRDIVQKREANVQNFLKRRPTQARQELGATGTAVQQSRARFGSDIENIAGEVSGSFGLPKNVGIKSSIEPKTQDLERQNKLDLSAKLFDQTRNSIRERSRFLMDRLTQAGIDRTLAENVSVQFANDEMQREFARGEQEKDIQQAFTEQDIKDAYADKIAKERERRAEEARKQAFKMGIIRSLFSLGGAVATGFALRGGGTGDTGDTGGGEA